MYVNLFASKKLYYIVGMKNKDTKGVLDIPSITDQALIEKCFDRRGIRH